MGAHPTSVSPSISFDPGESKHMRLEKIHQLWESTVDSIKSIPGIAYFLIFQKMQSTKSGNTLDLDNSDSPLVLYLLSVTWTLA